MWPGEVSGVSWGPPGHRSLQHRFSSTASGEGWRRGLLRGQSEGSEQTLNLVNTWRRVQVEALSRAGDQDGEGTGRRDTCVHTHTHTCTHHGATTCSSSKCGPGAWLTPGLHLVQRPPAPSRAAKSLLREGPTPASPCPLRRAGVLTGR